MLRAFAVLLLCASVAIAAPVPKTLKPKAPDLTNTRWDVARDGNKGIPYKYHFQEGGVLLHTVRGKEGRGRGTWEQRGHTVTLVYEGETVTYSLTYSDGVLEGTSQSMNFVWEKKLIPAKTK